MRTFRPQRTAGSRPRPSRDTLGPEPSAPNRGFTKLPLPGPASVDSLRKAASTELRPGARVGALPLNGSGQPSVPSSRAITTAAAASGAPSAATVGSVTLEVPPSTAPLPSAPGDGTASASEGLVSLQSAEERAPPQTLANNVVMAASLATAALPLGASSPVAVAAAALAAAAAEPFALSSSMPLADGRLDIVHWRDGRKLRIWTPPGYSRSEAAREPYPVVYLNDGQNLYDSTLTLSGHSWHAAEAASGLITSGQLPPFVIVGIDHAGNEMRSYDYLPYPPGNAGGYRLDADKWPGGGVEEYLRAVVDEILPYAERAYGVSSSPSLRAFGGSSFGGICALCCVMSRPGVFGSFLAESPSLWFGEERLLRRDLPAFEGPWPARLFLAMGTQEYSGVRSKKAPEFDAKLVSYTHELAGLLESRGLTRGSRLEVVVEEGATHTESAWAGRLQGALRFLGLHWWRKLMARRRDHLYFTVPRKLRAGQPAVLFFNQSRSAVLSHRPRNAIKMAYGFNVDWSVGGGQADMAPAAGLALLQLEDEQAKNLNSRRHHSRHQIGNNNNNNDTKKAGNGDSSVAAAQGSQQELSGAESASSAAAMVGADYFSGEGFDPSEGSHWLQAAFTVPPEAYEMHLAFHDGAGPGGGNWDNNAGSNFYMRVKMDMTATQRSHTVEQAMLEGPSWGNVQEIAHKRSGSTFFTTPEVLVAGQPAVLYVNRRRARGLEQNPNLRCHFGFSGWQTGGQEVCLKPTGLWRGEHIDWWSTTLTVPNDATDLSFVLTDGHGTWDNNYGNNYVCPVKQARPAPGAAATTGVEPRGVESIESMPHGAGTLHIVTFTKRAGGNRDAQRANKWTEEKRMRVWTPPGFDAANPPPGGYPVLFMQDGQNMFEDWLAHQGVSWRVGYTASDLVSRGELPPFLVVAVDSAGAMRSLNYLPYPPGTGAGGFRGDAERWPGGGLEAYMSRLVEEVMPLVQQRFGASSDPAKVAFGGGSFAGVAALYAALHYPHVFGCVLAESPSLWIAEGRFLQDMRMHRGMLPERLFLGCGTREYSATRDHVREDVDALLLSYCQEAASILESQGLRGGRLRFLVEEGAGHHELAWQWRLTGAMRFLFSAWWDE